MTRLINVIVLFLMFMGFKVYAAPVDPQAPILVLKAGQHGIILNIGMKPGQIIRGNQCGLEVIGSSASSVSGPGHQYELKYHGVPAGSVDPVIYWSATFRNLWLNPHVVILRCNTPRDFSLTLGEIEKDLSHTIRFY